MFNPVKLNHHIPIIMNSFIFRLTVSGAEAGLLQCDRMNSHGRTPFSAFSQQ